MEEEENEDNNIKIFEEEEEEILDDFLVKDIKSKILENYNISIENGNELLINEIIELHDRLGINDDELIQIIENCIINKLTDFSTIKNISEFIYQTNFDINEKIFFLKEFYKFISNPELEQNHLDKIKRLLPSILEKFSNKKIEDNYKNVFMQIKIEIILKIFEVSNYYIKTIITKCVKKNWNITNINQFQIQLMYIIPIEENKISNKENIENIRLENERDIRILESMLDIIETFPMNNAALILKDLDFNNRETIAREFYLKCSTNLYNKKKILDIDDLIITLENKNIGYFSKEKKELFKMQVNIAKRIKKPENYKEWINKFKSYDFKSKNKNYYTAEALGVISCALEETKKFPLREVQILAILIFIDNNECQEDIFNNEKREKKISMIKDNGKGIIEEISPGEGKSAIISCLSIYYGLKNRKVDIISSSRTLVIRDSFEFKELFQVFDLSVDYVKDENPGPYKADILYGTFLDFEGDLLKEITDNKEIRGERPYDIIIIDEVDNAFIDCIQGSTQLTYPSKGYQFLMPIYVSIYLMFELLNYFYINESVKKFNEIMSKEEYKNLDENIKYGIFEKINDSNKNKEMFLNYIKKIFKDLKNIDGEIEAAEGLKKYLTVPKYLNDFVELQLDNWIDNAFNAKNLYKKEIDYTISSKSKDGYESITPVDKSNTGELEFNTVYTNGLDQMLQIKEYLRIRPERLNHTFLSHVTYFTKFKKKNFFGLTGTIGGKESLTIYKRDYFKSNLIYIPTYISKRFIELPAIVCEDNFKIHIDRICEEIVYHFSKGRKVLIICKDINEGININDRLTRNDFTNKEPPLNNNIFLYLRNDIDGLEEELKLTEKRIIITTNLGGRGIDIKTSPEQEKNGGMHVIITKLSTNSRTQKQAFGRTSRQGKVGSGQFIVREKNNLRTFEQLVEERNKKEKKMIDNINLDKLFLKDELFQEYTLLLKKYPELNNEKGRNTKDEINERWALFLKKNFNCDLGNEEIMRNFKNFQSEIDKIMILPRYQRFNNYILRISDALTLDENEEFSPLEADKFLNFNNCHECFYFAASYLKALVEWYRYYEKFYNNYNDSEHCIKIIEHLKLAKKQLKTLIKINIEPSLRSIKMYKKLISNKNFKEKNNYKETSLYKKFETRKKILNNLIEHIDKNINTTSEYIKDYLPTNTIFNYTLLSKEPIRLKDCLLLEEDETKDLEYLYDSGFEFAFVLIIKKPIMIKNTKYYLIFLGFFISFLIGFISVSLSMKFANYLSNELSNNSRIEYVNIHENDNISLFEKIKVMISNIFEEEEENDEKNSKEKKQKEDFNQLLLNKIETRTLSIIKKKINEIFDEKIKDFRDEIKFLIFIDFFFFEKAWNDIIINIVSNSLDINGIILQKEELIKLFNDNSHYEKGIEKLILEIEKYISNILKEIHSEFNKEGYEKNKPKRLEHIIIKKLLEDIDYKSAIEIVKQILSQNIIDKKGKFNTNLFEDKKIKKKKN